MRPFAVHFHAPRDFGIFVLDRLEVRPVHKEVIEVVFRLETAALLKEFGVFFDGVQKDAVSDRAHEEGRDQSAVRHGKFIEVVVVAVEFAAAAVVARTEPENTARVHIALFFLNAHRVAVPVHARAVGILADEVAGKVVHPDAQRGRLNADLHRRGLYGDVFVALPRIDRRDRLFDGSPFVFLHHVVLFAFRPVSVRAVARKLDAHRARSAQFHFYLI